MKIIKLNKIKIINFRSISDMEIDFTKGLNVIVGKNGKGKTTIMNSVYTCLYNRQLNGRPASSGIKNGKDKSYIELLFTINNEDYNMQRTIGKKSSVVLYKNGDKLATGANVKKIIDDLIPNDIVKLNMLQQLDIKKLVSNYADVSDFINRITAKQNENDEKLYNLKAKIDDHENKIENIKSSIASIKNIYESELEKVNNLKNDLMNIENTLNNSSINNKEIIHNKIETINKFNFELKTTYENIEKDIQNKIQSECNIPIQNLKFEIESLNQQYTNETNEIDKKAISEINKLINDKNEFSYQIKQLNSEIKKYEDLINQKICFVCEHEINDYDMEKYNNKILELKNNISHLENNINIINRKIDELKNIAYNEKMDAYNNVTEKIKKINQQIEDLLVKKEKLEDQLSDSEIQNKKYRIYQDLLKKYNLSESDLNKNYSETLKLIDNKIKLESMINAINDNLESINKKLIEETKKYKKIISDKSINDTKIEIENLEEEQRILSVWKNTRLLNKLIVKKLSKTIDKIIKTRYNSLIDVSFDIDENDNIIILSKNHHGDLVPFEDTSTGEGIISKLVLYSAIRDVFSSEYDLKTLFLDEFLDNLDEINASKSLFFLKNQSDKYDLSIFVISHRPDIQNELAEQIIDMNNI